MSKTLGVSEAKRILHKLFSGYRGNLAVRLWNGEQVTFGQGLPEVTLNLTRARPLRDLVLFRDPLRLAREYMRGTVDVEGDFYAALRLRAHLEELALSAREKISVALATFFLRDGLEKERKEGSVERSWHGWFPTWFAKTSKRKAIAFHYDISNDFYRLWLDEQMLYSCAYFEEGTESLQKAQCDKLDHICRKLRLREGERLLDIGCGWGGLVIWAARHYGVRAHGITLSQNQYVARQQNLWVNFGSGRAPSA